MAEPLNGLEPILEVHFEDDYQPIPEYTELQRAVMPLFAVTEAGEWQGLGTAFSIADDGLLLTARHVIIDHADGLRDGTCKIVALYETSEPVLGPDGRLGDIGAWLYATEVSTTDATDLALIRTTPLEIGGSRVPLPTLALTTQPPAEGDTCVAFGYPHLTAARAADEEGVLELERTLVASRGTVAAVHPERRDRGKLWYPTFQLGARLPNGMSGGPIVSNGTGGVLGITCSGLPDEPGSPPVSWGSMLGPLLDFPVPGKDVTVATGITSGYIEAHEAELRFTFERAEDGWRVRHLDS